MKTTITKTLASLLPLFLLLISLFLFYATARSQTFTTNPETNLISIKDSVELKNISLQDAKEIISKWGHGLIDLDNLKTIYKLNNSKQTETVTVNLPVGTVLTAGKRQQ